MEPPVEPPEPSVEPPEPPVEPPEPPVDPPEPPVEPSPVDPPEPPVVPPEPPVEPPELPVEPPVEPPELPVEPPGFLEFFDFFDPVVEPPFLEPRLEERPFLEELFAAVWERTVPRRAVLCADRAAATPPIERTNAASSAIAMTACFAVRRERASIDDLRDRRDRERGLCRALLCEQSAAATESVVATLKVSTDRAANASCSGESWTHDRRAPAPTGRTPYRLSALIPDGYSIDQDRARNSIDHPAREATRMPA